MPGVSFHAACIKKIEARIGVQLIKLRGANYGTADGGTHVVCAASHTYELGSRVWYWFSIQRKHHDDLKDSKGGYVAFGCGSADTTLLIPAARFLPLLDRLNVTKKGERVYWHVTIVKEGDRLMLRPRSGYEQVDLSGYLL